MSNYDYKNVASDYDDLLKQYEWQAPELLFNYLSKYIQSDTKLLDVGVGTGISSQRFHEQGVELYGLDNSPDMLSICKAKDVFKEVHLYDILKDDKIPYPNATFEYTICLGVLHFFSSLDHLFTEISRVLKRDGLFAFTIMENQMNDIPYISETTNGIDLYFHNNNYINEITQKYNFAFIYGQTFTTLKDLNTKETLDHQLKVLRKELNTHL